MIKIKFTNLKLEAVIEILKLPLIQLLLLSVLNCCSIIENCICKGYGIASIAVIASLILALIVASKVAFFEATKSVKPFPWVVSVIT